MKIFILKGQSISQKVKLQCVTLYIGTKAELIFTLDLGLFHLKPFHLFDVKSNFILMLFTILTHFLRSFDFWVRKITSKKQRESDYKLKHILYTFCTSSLDWILSRNGCFIGTHMP